MHPDSNGCRFDADIMHQCPLEALLVSRRISCDLPILLTLFQYQSGAGSPNAAPALGLPAQLLHWVCQRRYGIGYSSPAPALGLPTPLRHWVCQRSSCIGSANAAPALGMPAQFLHWICQRRSGIGYAGDGPALGLPALPKHWVGQHRSGIGRVSGWYWQNAGNAAWNQYRLKRTLMHYVGVRSALGFHRWCRACLYWPSIKLTVNADWVYIYRHICLWIH